MAMLIDEELTLKKLEVFLAFMRTGNKAFALERDTKPLAEGLGIGQGAPGRDRIQLAGNLVLSGPGHAEP